MSGINLYEKELFFYKWYERKYYFYIKYGEIFIMANSDELITSVGKNANDTAALVWSVADDLVGAYKPHEYGLVILPMTVIKRFHDCLLPTHQTVLDTYKKVEKLGCKRWVFA